MSQEAQAMIKSLQGKIYFLKNTFTFKPSITNKMIKLKYKWNGQCEFRLNNCKGETPVLQLATVWKELQNSVDNVLDRNMNRYNFSIVRAVRKLYRYDIPIWAHP